MALQNDGLGLGLNGEYFTNAPSGDTALFLAPDAPSLLNIAPVGRYFLGAISFFYSSNDAVTDAVQVFSGDAGTGSLLGSFSLTVNAATGCADSPFCHWSLATINFNGLARSVRFSNAAADNVVFDNLTVNVVPEPGSALMVAIGLAGLALTVRRGRS